MNSVIYDNTKTLATNVQTLFKYSNWLYREMLEGRVKDVTANASLNAENIIKAEQNVTELDLANIVAEQTITDLDIRLTALESEGN